MLGVTTAEKDPPNLKSTGLLQQHNGDKRQYVYWMTMPHPKPETVTAHGLKVPEEFTRPDFIDLGVEVHTACGAPFTGAWRCSFIKLLAFEGRGSTAALFFGWCSKTCQLPGTV